MIDIAKTAGSQFKNSTMIWQGQLWKYQETYVCDPVLLAEDWLVAQDRQLVQIEMLNKDSNLRGDYMQRAELALAVLGYTSPEVMSHHWSGVTIQKVDKSGALLLENTYVG